MDVKRATQFRLWCRGGCREAYDTLRALLQVAHYSAETPLYMATVQNPVLLVVLDGWGHSDSTHYNAIHAARKPHWDRMWQECPHTLIRCSGLDVGLPDEQMGNSEVGHMHIGAGRLINQDFTRISLAVKTGAFFSNPVLVEACQRAARKRSTLHILGLLSPGGVHSHETHLVALLELAAKLDVARVAVHAFLDGRDTPPQSAEPSLRYVQTRCAELRLGHIASICGRYFAMDRNKNWERTRIAYELIAHGHAPFTAADPLSALRAAYARGETDEFVQPTAIETPNTPPLGDDDVVIFANFRADRARQLTSAFTAEEFAHFPRHTLRFGQFIAMTDYGAQFKVPVAFPTIDIRHTFGEVLAARGLRQLRIAETEKYAHVTFFFNGGTETPFAGEDRILVPSPSVATYDMQPEMSAAEVTNKLIEAIASREYDAIVCNYANADMVGHTGDFAATVKCIETLDTCLGRLRDACHTHAMEMLITSDHGNAEQMLAHAPEANGSVAPHTAHTSNLVPLVYCGRRAEMAGDGCLSDVAPTLLALMDLPQPSEMTGHSLVRPQRAQHAA